MPRPHRTPVYLYVLDPDLNAALVRLLKKRGFKPIQLDHRLCVDPVRNVVIVETGDDVAHLNQVVNHFYLTYKIDSTLPLLAFLSRKAIERNPMVRCWLIDGRSAITQIISRKSKRKLRDREKRAFLWSLLRLLPLYHD